MLRSIVNCPGIGGVSPEEKKERRWELFAKRKVLCLEWKSEWVVDDESGDSTEPMGEVSLVGLGESELERFVRG